MYNTEGVYSIAKMRRIMSLSRERQEMLRRLEEEEDDIRTRVANGDVQAVVRLRLLEKLRKEYR